MIDSRQATEALDDINQIVHRVRQSRIYNLTSLLMIMWGALVFVGNIATHLWPRTGGLIWIVVDTAGVLGSFAISALSFPKSGVRTFDTRVLLAFLLYFAFGYFFSSLLGHFTPRQLGTFWPLYCMLTYTIVGLWFGHAFIAIGVAITVLTLIGYFFVGDWFQLWMAVVNGGGLILGGLWMRRS